jgi:16S rRNA (guanine(966)-N(2))-methyltransferase RsmD
LLRVLGGSLRGKKLYGPKGLEFRPTTGRVKEFIFFLIRETIPGSSFLDLFAGTGSLGLEALSRGAREGRFIEKSSRSVIILRKNIEACGFSRQADILAEDVFAAMNRLGRRKEMFDFIFADPPFKDSLRSRIVDAADQNQLLNPAGVLILEHDIRDPDAKGYRLQMFRQKRFGDCMVSFYNKGPMK